MNDEFACFVCGVLPFAALGFGLLLSRVRKAEARTAEALASLEEMKQWARAVNLRLDTIERGSHALSAKLAEAVPAAAESASADDLASAAARVVEAHVASAAEPLLPAEGSPSAAAPLAFEPAAVVEPSLAAAQETAATDLASASPTSSGSGFGAGYAPPTSSGGGFGAGYEPPTSTGGGSGSGSEPPTSTPSLPDISWEQWLGVRGAAAAGAIVLMIAAVYFFRYSMEHGLISPTTRVVLGTLTGLGCVAASELRLRRVHQTLSEYLAGAGFAILYLTFWAASARFHLVPNAVTSVLMVAVTAASCTLAYVRSAAPVAALSLVGGFATPILLSTGSDRPIALFSYLLLLDVALMFVARKRAWAWVAFASVVCTFFYQALWLITRMGPGTTAIGVGIILVFGLLFAWIAWTDEGPSTFRGTSVLALSATALLTVYFGATAHLGRNLVPTAVLVVLLSVGGAVLSQKPSLALCGPMSALAAVLSFAIAVLSTRETSSTATIAATTALGLVFVQCATRELARRRARAANDVTELSLGIVAVGTILLLVIGKTIASAPFHPTPHLVVLFVTVALVSFDAVRSADYFVLLVVDVLFAIALSLMHFARGDEPGFPPESLFLGLLVGAAVLVQLAPLRASASNHPSRRLAEHGAGAVVVGLLLQFVAVADQPHVRLLPYLGCTLGLFALSAPIATRLGNARWSIGAVSVGALAHTAMHSSLFATSGRVPVLLGFIAWAVLVTSLPLLVSGEARLHVSTWRAASLGAPSILAPALTVYGREGHDSTRGLLPLLLSVFGLVVVALSRRVPDIRPETRRSAFAWGAVAALALVSVAIPVQLRNEWVTVGWAIQGAAVIVLWKHFDHTGIKYYAMTLFAFVTIRLVFNSEVLTYHAPSGRPIVNWLAYTYLVPVICFVVSAATLDQLEVRRQRPRERELFHGQAVLAASLGLAAIVIGFVWINLTVVDAFATGRSLELPVERRPARDLALSLAWAVYAGTLLAIGLWRKNTALRKTSLGLVILTCLKVFLYDLGALRDLYRVASLLGLAVTLIGVSLVYKHFVFRDSKESE